MDLWDTATVAEKEKFSVHLNNYLGQLDKDGRIEVDLTFKRELQDGVKTFMDKCERAHCSVCCKYFIFWGGTNADF